MSNESGLPTSRNVPELVVTMAGSRGLGAQAVAGRGGVRHGQGPGAHGHTGRGGGRHAQDEGHMGTQAGGVHARMRERDYVCVRAAVCYTMHYTHDS